MFEKLFMRISKCKLRDLWISHDLDDRGLEHYGEGEFFVRME